MINMDYSLSISISRCMLTYYLSWLNTIVIKYNNKVK